MTCKSRSNSWCKDNLNTHALSKFYDCLPAAMTEKLTTRFEVYYTPKCGS